MILYVLPTELPLACATPLTITSKRRTHLSRVLNITPEVLALWAKICVSADVLRELLGEFESWEAKTRGSPGGGKFKSSFLPPRDSFTHAVDYCRLTFRFGTNFRYR